VRIALKVGKLSSGDEMYNALSQPMENGCYDISQVEFGEDPKHFLYMWPFIVTSQMSALQKEVFNFHDTARMSPKATERNI
jgi:hypothetical protein